MRIREAGAECALRGGGRVGVRGEPLGEPWGLRWEWGGEPRQPGLPR